MRLHYPDDKSLYYAAELKTLARLINILELNEDAAMLVPSSGEGRKCNLYQNAKGDDKL